MGLGSLLRCSVAAVLLVAAHVQAQCNLNITVTFRNFNAVGAGPNANPDFGFLPEPANIPDTAIIRNTIGADKKPVYSPASGFNTTTTHSAIDFNQWWNVATTYSQDAILTFAEMLDSSGIKAFIFAQAPFFPLNGQLLGAANPSANNRYFTIEAHYSVLYRATSAPAFSFTTTLDLFVYLNGERIVNMGGVHALNTTTVDLTTLGLQDGLVYDVDLFLAQRHGPGSPSPSLQMSSNVDFASGVRTQPFCDANTPPDGPGNNSTELDQLYPTPVAPPEDGFPGVPGCIAVWGVAGADTCGSIAKGVGLDNAAALVAFNPGLDCTALKAGQLVCTGTQGAPTATCGFRVYPTTSGDTCLSVRDAFGTNGIPIPFAVLDALNPGLDCGPAGQTALKTGTNICLPALTNPASGRRRRSLLDAGLTDTSAVSAESGLQLSFPAGVMAGDLVSHMEPGTSLFRPRDAFRRALQQTAAPSCIGATFVAEAGSCGISCASAAQQAGMTVTQLVLLNPQLLSNANGLCAVTAGQTLCKGCTGTVCGVKLSTSMATFLNFPSLNLFMCGMLADCSNSAYVEGAADAQDEQLVITIEKQSASTRGYTAAGGPQIAAFFDPDTGLAITKPGSQLALSIYPNYYSNKPKVAPGAPAALVVWNSIVVFDGTAVAAPSPPAAGRRKLLAFRLPVYRGGKKYRTTSANPPSMFISKWRRIW
eukprot:CAMPEP_0206137638 /NCGR_PEP_ID=MMETSP1473-20131121/2729_1 /ASSEMBLY_ACC=CAM_ASM_001109 /TAXON_ID=1461547 /ORGANISM="Stichococcus sp, Strain RCC1054" /LENGTH=705 /DNA_ID=CAMNT_0053530825 /DNA_START=617 /DNA_END=2734 /DNA_ORIENTATION=-